VIGDAATMRAAIEIIGAPINVRVIRDISDTSDQKGSLEVVDLHNIHLDHLTRGKIDPVAGKASFEYVKLATELALDSKCQALVTSAISKEAWHAAGLHYNGHTELLAEICGVDEVAMMLLSGQLRVSHVTTHVSLSRAIELIEQTRIVVVIKLTERALQGMGIEKPRLAVAGLNPHAGENGLFGDEEEKHVIPAIRATQDIGMNVTGPLPPDSVFLRTSKGQFDAAVAMYHDQGHIAVKMLGITEGVNLTLGLPIIRTSVDHGTVFGKAGKGSADPGSLIQAIKLASIMSCDQMRLSQTGK
jgi:4-hydroxythreonine-4-phosphate dehydrogenase